MIQKQNSLPDFKQETSYLRDDSQISVNGGVSIPMKAYVFYDHLIMKIKTYSFIVDWQLPEMEQLEVDKSHS